MRRVVLGPLFAVLCAGCSATGLGVGTPSADAGPRSPGDARSSADRSSPADAGTPPAPWPGPRFVELALGDEHSCALDDRGDVWCWGNDINAQLGQGLRHRHECGRDAWPMPCRPWAERMEGLPPIAHVEAGKYRTCAVGVDGDVWCFGEGPRPMPTLPPVRQLAIGSEMIALLRDGRVIRFDPGALELEVLERLGDVRSIDQEGGLSCALAEEGTVWCWDDVGGRSGCGASCEPTRVVGLEDVEELAVPCARTIDGEVWCWDVTLVDREITPARHVASLDGAQAVASGEGAHPCTVDAEGQVRCVWEEGEAFAPRGLSRVHAIEVDGHFAPHACGLLEGGSVWCWGNNTAGQLGRGDWDLADHKKARPIRIGAPPSSEPAVPEPDDPGWEPLLTLPERCTIERALDPSAEIPIAWEPCTAPAGAASCRRAALRGRPRVAWGFHDGEHGYFAFKRLEVTHMHRHVVLASTDPESSTVAVWREPRDSGPTDEPGPSRWCMIAGPVALDAGYAAVRVDVGPWPTRVFHAPIREVGALRSPTGYHTRLRSAAREMTVSESAVVVNEADHWLHIIQAHESRTLNLHPSPGHGDGVELLGGRALWLGHDTGVVHQASLRTRADPFLDRPGDIVSFGTNGDRMDWIEAFPTTATRFDYERFELWTTSLGADTLHPEPRGSLESQPDDPVYGDGLVAFRSPSSPHDEVTVLRLADGARLALRLPGDPFLSPIYVAADEVLLWAQTDPRHAVLLQLSESAFR